jgi:hypothetical protein
MCIVYYMCVWIRGAYAQTLRRENLNAAMFLNGKKFNLKMMQTLDVNEHNI